MVVIYDKVVKRGGIIVQCSAGVDLTVRHHRI